MDESEWNNENVCFKIQAVNQGDRRFPGNKYFESELNDNSMKRVDVNMLSFGQ